MIRSRRISTQLARQTTLRVLGTALLSHMSSHFYYTCYQHTYWIRKHFLSVTIALVTLVLCIFSLLFVASSCLLRPLPENKQIIPVVGWDGMAGEVEVSILLVECTLYHRRTALYVVLSTYNLRRKSSGGLNWFLRF